VRPEGLGNLIKIIHLIGSLTRDLPVCNIAPKPTTLPRTPSFVELQNISSFIENGSANFQSLRRKCLVFCPERTEVIGREYQPMKQFCLVYVIVTSFHMLRKGGSNRKLCKIRGFHDADYEECRLLGCQAVLTVVRRDASEECITTIIRLERISYLGITLAVTGN
jgi:hypothetical protein